MAVKKDPFRFTVLFNPDDPIHQQTVAVLNRQGRRKAQFIANAVMHYLNCNETPPMQAPTPSAVDKETILAVVAQYLKEREQIAAKPREPDVRPQPVQKQPQSEEVTLNSAAEDLLGEDGLAAIRNSLASFGMK